jgi:hypothetical protein
MRALVVFESLFGNTATIGESVAASLRALGLESEARPVTGVDPASTAEVDLLIVGGPTHAHGMSREATRKAGATDKKNEYREPTIEPGLRGWFDEIPAGGGRAAAAFDTRFDKPMWITGSAAKGIAKRLLARGFRLATDPESFFVTSENQLEAGQTVRAEAWAAQLATRMPAITSK